MINIAGKRSISAFLLPVFCTYAFFYGSLVFFIDFPIEYALGNRIVEISFLDQIHVILLILAFICALALPQLAVAKFRTNDSCTVDSFSIKTYIVIGSITILASFLNCTLKLPNEIENLVRILSLMSLYVVSYGIFQFDKTSERRNKNILFLIIIINTLTFAILPLFLGYLSKLILLIGSLLFVIFYEKSKRKVKLIVIFVVVILLIALVFQSYKSHYRKSLFGGHFKKINTQKEWVDKKFDPVCDINKYFSNLPIARVDKNSKNNYLQQKLELYETGNLILDFKSANELIKKNYSGVNLLEGLQDFRKTSKEALEQDNFVLLLGISRAWGNYLPRDGTRAARLLIKSADKMPASANTIFGTLLLDGNGVQLDIEKGVQCAFESKNHEVIDYVVQHEKGIVPSVIDRYIYLTGNELMMQVEESRLKYLKGINKSQFEVRNDFSRLHTQLYGWVKSFDANLDYSISGGLDRLDQMRNFVVALKGLSNVGYKEYDPYRLILWSLVPRVLYPSKPLISDEAGILIGKIFRLEDPHDPNLSWALPFLSETIIFGGVFNLLISFFMASIIYSVYFFQGLKSINLLFIYGNMGLANILMGLFTGCVGVLSGLIQCFLFLQVAYIAHAIIKRFSFAKIL